MSHVYSRSRRPPRYAELRAASAFSFLEASSMPEELAERAAELELPAVALTDRNGVYGAPRFHRATGASDTRALVGAEVVVDDGRRAPKGAPAKDRSHESRLTLLVESRSGYRHLCRLLTDAALPHPKGEARASWERIAAHTRGLHCLVGAEGSPVARALQEEGLDAARETLERLARMFPGRLHVELQRHRLRGEEHRNRALVDLAESLALPLVATNGVRYAHGEGKPLQDVLAAIRCGTTLDAAGRLLAENRERHLKSAAEMAALFPDLPHALEASAELAERCTFTLEDLGYRFPDFPLPPGETPDSYLAHLAWNGARARFRPLTARAQGQIEKELTLVAKLGLAGYFLIVWDIVCFCREEGILAQGRGSAANSAVCFALSITAVDPVKMELLFERFLSEERGEWPDIDLDLPSGTQRERVIQYVYQRYGERGAAMTANVITYRDRSAAREVGKALGYSPDQVDRLSKTLGHWSYDRSRGDVRGERELWAELAGAGFDPEEPRVQLFGTLWEHIHHLPRHLGQHSGGMVIAAGRLDEVVPLEPASMEGRVVVQWDKDDCADLQIIKVDLLGLGMLNALEEIVPTIREREGKHVDLAHLPPDDPKTYELLRKADTVGVFQVESRAQMATLPKNRPERFYDLVIQVAIIRPGPIVGRLAHPYFERRQGREEVTYPHPSLEPVLRRTLGIPIFQEQILKVAMTVAGFSGGEAEELRRAMGAKRSMDKMRAIEARLRQGMAERGIRGKAQDEILQAITSFALYGFPESHAASFALIAYASAYLKAHHPTAFTLGLLNAWPMGFYHPSTVIKDAERHGVTVLPIDVDRSDWLCLWEGGKDGSIRLGMKFVKGLRRGVAERIARERRAGGPFDGPEDLARRTDLRRDELETLASLGALGSLGLSRRQALWQAARVSREAGPLLEELPDETPSPLPEMSPIEETTADFRSSAVTVGPHPVAHLRPQLKKMGVLRAVDLDRFPSEAKVKIAGSVIVRQRPGTAKGVLFVTLEDETGMSQAVVSAELLQEHRAVIVGSPGLIVEGRLRKRDGAVAVQAETFRPLVETATGKSHDFR